LDTSIRFLARAAIHLRRRENLWDCLAAGGMLPPFGRTHLPMSRTFSCAAVLLSLSLPSLSAIAQTPVAACGTPPAVLTSTQPNIFSEQQEQWLGDAMADMLEGYAKPVQDPAENEYLDHIAKRLLAVLPPTNIRFRVILVDWPVVNAVSLAGGRVYVTRKLVANAQTEDEVAAVIAHEMGHILSHQIADETTADMKRLLGVTSVGDKADIYAKFQRLMDARMTDKHPGPDPNSDEKQNEADAVSVYATAASGYRPQAFTDWWNRMFFVNGKVGGPIPDFFGFTKPESKRLRAIEKLMAGLPQGCGGSQPNDSAEFEKWRELVMANQAGTLTADIKPASESTLTPPLRMDLQQLRFSRDGKYILAQDETSVFVLGREPYQPLFRFDAEGALPAEFTPDSQRIVFNTRGLHTEEWSIADRKLVASHELVSKNTCFASKLAPDGRTLLCIYVHDADSPGVGFNLAVMGLALLDTSTGSVLYQKDDFLKVPGTILAELAFAANWPVPVEVMRSSLSADGNYLLIGGGRDKLAFDLRTRSMVPMGKELKSSVDRAYAFVGNDKVLGEAQDPRDTGLFSFPDGKRISSAAFRVDDLESVTDGDYVLSHDVKDNAVGLADVSQAKFVAVSKSFAMDVWNGWLTNENVNGGVLLSKVSNPGAAGSQIAMLPLSPLGSSGQTALSADGRLLAVSSGTRGGVWDVNTGKRIVLLRAFNAAFFGANNSLYAEFAKHGAIERSVARLAFAPVGSTPLPYKEEDDTDLGPGTLQQWKHPDKKHTELIVHKIDDNSVLWSRTFEGDAPGHTYNLVPGQTILSSLLTMDSAKAALKESPELAAQAANIKDKGTGRLIQVLDNTNGKVLEELVLTVPVTYAGVTGVNVAGDNLYLTSGDNRTMVYSVKTRAQLRQIFGYVIAMDAASNRICTVNRRDEAIVYDAAGHQMASYHTGAPLRFAHFERDGSRLLLLTADQKVRVVEIEAGTSN
jgi:hypothetical protein